MGRGVTIRTIKNVSILFILSLLIFTVCHPAPFVQASTFPVESGVQTWEYSEFTKAFNEYLTGRNSTFSYLFLAMGLFLVALLAFELLRRARKFRSQEDDCIPSPIAPPTKAEQRRAWARLESSLMCRYMVTPSRPSLTQNMKTTSSSGADKEAEMEWGLIVDLSGGGCKIATSRDLRVGDELDLLLELEPRHRLALKGQVARTERGSNADQTFFAGVEFKEIREAVRDQIISWMFKHQQNILEGQRRLAEGLCLRCGKLLTEGMRQQTVFCSKCNRLRNDRHLN